MDVLTRLSFAIASSLIILVISQRIQLNRMEKKYEEMKKRFAAHLRDLDEGTTE